MSSAHVTALFRVTSCSRNDRGEPLVRMSATYATRDGLPCEENKSFSRWTPSGELELAAEHEGVPLFEKDAYVHLDLWSPPEAAPEEVPAGGRRIPMFVSRFDVDAASGRCFYSKLYPREGVRGMLSMQVTNFSEPCVQMFRLEPGEEPRAVVLDLSPG